MMRLPFILFIVVVLFPGGCKDTSTHRRPATRIPLVTANQGRISTTFNLAAFKSNLRLPTPRNFEYREKFVTFGNAAIRYLETGMKTQPAVVLLHGAQLRAESWKNLGTMRYLAQLGFRVISVDLPRHGKTGNPKVLKEDYLFQFLTHAKITNPIVLGQSYAGSYVLPFLVKYANSVKGVILLAPTSIRDYLPQLKTVSVTALILWGESDEMISVQQAYLLHGTLAESILKIFPGAPHECYLSGTSQFHNEIGHFVTRLFAPHKHHA
ncbi:MAG: alpha/beta hydrolase [Deltaproteobacteria bacterium]|nr:alpha/beta hydrolase [Deltaproteobacteria bacterium]